MINVGEEGKMNFLCFLIEIEGAFLFKRHRSCFYKYFQPKWKSNILF